MRYFQAGADAVESLSFTPNGESLVCVDADREQQLHKHRAVHWLSARTGEQQRTLNLREEAWFRSISYAADCHETGQAYVSPNGLWVAVQRYIGDPVLLDLWYAKTGEWREIDLGEHWFVVEGVCFSANSDLMIFACGTDGGGTRELGRLDLQSEQEVPAIDFPGYSARQLQLTQDGQRLAALTYGSVFTTRISSWTAGEVNWTKLDLEISDSASLRFSPDGKELAIVDGPQLFFWDCESGAVVKRVIEGDGINDLAYSPDGRLHALGYEDGTVILQERETGREVKRYDWKIGRVASVAFAPDGMTIAAGGDDGRGVRWDVDA